MPLLYPVYFSFVTILYQYAINCNVNGSKCMIHISNFYKN